jgi:hypothetical protein
MIPASSETSLIQVAKRTFAETCCPFCRDSLGETGTKTCPGCQTRYHSACALELPSCAILGCEAVIGAKTAPSPRSKDAQGRAILQSTLVVAALALAPFLPTLAKLMAESDESFKVSAFFSVWVLTLLYVGFREKPSPSEH